MSIPKLAPSPPAEANLAFSAGVDSPPSSTPLPVTTPPVAVAEVSLHPLWERFFKGVGGLLTVITLLTVFGGWGAKVTLWVYQQDTARTQMASDLRDVKTDVANLRTEMRQEFGRVRSDNSDRDKQQAAMNAKLDLVVQALQRDDSGTTVRTRIP